MTPSFCYPSLAKQGLWGSLRLVCVTRTMRLPSESPIPLPPFPGWVTLPGLGMGEMQKGCQSRRHPPNDQPSIPHQSQQGQRLAAHGGGAVCFEAMPELAP